MGNLLFLTLERPAENVESRPCTLGILDCLQSIEGYTHQQGVVLILSSVVTHSEERSHEKNRRNVIFLRLITGRMLTTGIPGRHTTVVVVVELIIKSYLII